MRVKYFASTSLDEIESTVNNLIGLGWELQTPHPVMQTNGEYLMCMFTHDRRPRYYAEAMQTGQRVAMRPSPPPTEWQEAYPADPGADVEGTQETFEFYDEEPPQLVRRN